MRICIVLYDPQEFGGLEEYATSLAIGLQQLGHKISVLSTTWVSPNNQYVRRLRENNVPIIQLPKWISYPASNWYTKEQIVASLLLVLTPLTYLLAAIVFILKGRSWKESVASAYGWLRRKLMWPYIGKDWSKPPSRLLLTWWRLRWRPDLLHIQGYTRNLLYVIDWAYVKGVPVVYEEHMTPDPRFDWWNGFQSSINKASIVVAVSEKSAQALKTVCGVTRTIVVRNPLLPDPIPSGWQKGYRKDRSDGIIFITTVARLDVAKGLNYLLEAIVLVKEVHPLVQFKVYGNGRLRNELLAHASQLGLDGNSIFVGSFSDRHELLQIMADTDIFVLSSILEGQPLGVVEAMAYGCPIVTTSVGGIPELIRDGVNGLLCMPGDPQCLADKVNKLIDDPALSQRLGLAARKTYEQGPFQTQSVCDHFVSIYRQVLEKENLVLAT